MKRLGLKILRRKPAQASAQSGLIASTATSDSGFAFVHNCQGASAALSELSGKLSDVLELIDLDEYSTDGPVAAQVRRLENAAGSYSNSNSASYSGLAEWEGSQSLAQVVSVAFNCAATVYKRPPKSTAVHDSETGQSELLTTHRQPCTPEVTFTEREYIGPSKGGTEKSMGVWMAESDTSCEELPALVIAIRGTAKFVDAMVNANGRPIPAAQFLGTDQVPSIENAAVSISAHAGFLASAAALHSSVNYHLSKADKEQPGMHVIFTGHSAGGAVASILYVKCLLEAAKAYPSLKLSIITFGAPPTLSVDITDALRAASLLVTNRGHTLAFVNEFDIVPRVDQAYVRSIIDLYRASYNLGPLMTDAVAWANGHEAAVSATALAESVYILPPLEFQSEEEERISPKDSRPEQGAWNLPFPEYHILGDVVLLRKDHLIDTGSLNTVVRQLRAFNIPLREYQKLLYCGTQTHGRPYYNDRVDLLRQGKFNNRESWASEPCTCR